MTLNKQDIEVINSHIKKLDRLKFYVECFESGNNKYQFHMAEIDIVSNSYNSYHDFSTLPKELVDQLMNIIIAHYRSEIDTIKSTLETIYGVVVE